MQCNNVLLCHCVQQQLDIELRSRLVNFHMKKEKEKKTQFLSR